MKLSPAPPCQSSINNCRQRFCFKGILDQLACSKTAPVAGLRRRSATRITWRSKHERRQLIAGEVIEKSDGTGRVEKKLQAAYDEAPCAAVSLTEEIQARRHSFC